MSLLRPSPILRSFAASYPTRCLITSKRSSPSRLFASSYGDGEGDPKGGDPQNQGPNPSADLEHPGPPPPAEGQGTGGGPTKAGKDGHNTPQNDASGGSSSKSDTGSNGSSNGAQPKILNEKPPAEPSEDVKKHNEDFDNRYGAQNKSDHNEKDKVGKGFWSGKVSLTKVPLAPSVLVALIPFHNGFADWLIHRTRRR